MSDEDQIKRLTLQVEQRALQIKRDGGGWVTNQPTLGAPPSDRCYYTAAADEILGAHWRWRVAEAVDGACFVIIVGRA